MDLIYNLEILVFCAFSCKSKSRVDIRVIVLINVFLCFISFCLLEPCPPNNVQTNLQCQHNLGTVTWEASFGAVQYGVILAGRDGHSLSCYTNNTFCNIEGLNCGVTYYTNVIAIGEVFNSSSSSTVLLVSGNVHRRFHS